MRRYITNMRNWQRPIVKDALGLPGMAAFAIDDEPWKNCIDAAFWPCMIGSHFSVYYDLDRIPQDYLSSDFWRVYKETHESEKWKVYVFLHSESG